MSIVQKDNREACYNAISGQSVAIVNPERTLAALYEKKRNEDKNAEDTFLCIIKKIGEPTNVDEAIEISMDSFIETFLNYSKKHWLSIPYKETNIITSEDKFLIEKQIERYKSEE